MVIVTLIFVLLYAAAFTGKFDPLKDNTMLLRLEPSAEVNANWKVKARLDSAAQLNKDTTDSSVKLQRIWAEGNYKNLNVQLGKFPDASGYDKSMMFNNQMSGAAVTVGNKLKATVTAGRIDLGGDSQYKNLKPFGADDAAANLQSLVLGYTTGKLSGTAAYYHESSDVFKDAHHTYLAYSKTGTEDNAGIWEAAGSYRFDKNVALSGAYAENTKADYYQKAGMVQLDYKASNKANVGSWGAYIAYRHLGGNAVIDPNVDGVGNNQKGWEVGTQYTLFKNVQAKAIYFKGKDLSTDKDASKLFGRVEFFF